MWCLSIVVGDIAKPATKYFQLCCGVVPFEFVSVCDLQVGNAVVLALELIFTMTDAHLD